MDPTNPLAQGSQAEANGSEGNTTPDPLAGIQKRIDEVVGNFHRSERRGDELQTLVAQQQATIAQLQGQAAAPQEVAPEIDPEDQKRMDYIINKATAPLREQIAKLSQGLVQNRNSNAMSQVAEQLKKINNPAVTAKTQELLNMWERDGRLANGTYLPTDAVRWAIGHAALESVGEQSENNSQRQQYNQGFVPPLGTNGGGRKPQGAPAPQGNAQAKDLTEMSEDELKTFIINGEKANPEGFSL